MIILIKDMQISKLYATKMSVEEKMVSDRFKNRLRALQTKINVYGELKIK